ncbi:MAG: hypothetical protein OCD76_14785 [Reichenbachiella sp.]
MIKKFLGILIIVGFFSTAMAKYDEPLNHVGLSRIYNKKVQKDFSSRFNATGEPLFLIGNIKRGIAIGDMIRFDNKMMLIDAEVWQTMKSTGVLKLLKNAPVISIKAKARSSIWNSRASKARGEEKKAYTLGSAFLSTMEDRFTYTPTAMELVLRFEGSNMILMAPKELLKKLVFKRGKTPTKPKKGSPQIVTEDRGVAFKGQKFEHQLWAIDLENPGRNIKYKLKSPEPKGLTWSRSGHTLSGKAKKAGVYKLKFEAKNKAGRIDKQVFKLTIRNNEDPKILGNPESIVAKGSVWEYTPIITDPDHLINSLKVKAIDVPKGIKFNKDTHQFTLKSGLSKDEMKALEKECFSIQAKDPVGGSAEREVCFDESASLAFKSALSSNKLQLGQAAYYRPVAVGPSQKIKYKVYDMNHDLIEKGKKHFRLSTDQVGSYGLLFEAEDDQGNKATQLISYKVSGTKSNWHGGGLNVQHLANNVFTTHLYYRNAGTRVGIIFPNMTENIPNFFSGIGRELSLMDIPFVIAGLNATGEEQEAEGNTLFIEGGMKLWATDGILAGGFFIRMDGQYNSYQTSDMVVEYKVQYFANQGVLIVDDENIKNNNYGRDSVDKRMEELRGNGSHDLDDFVDSLRAIHPGLDEMVDNYSNENNDVLLIELQTWFKMKTLSKGLISLWAAPLYWYEDHVYSDDLSQHGLAAGVKAIVNTSNFVGDFHLRLGATINNETSAFEPVVRGGASIFFGRVNH